MDKRSEIVEKVAMSILGNRGVQGPRKDRDLIKDTGGTSKGRDLATPMKPSRTDLKKRYRTKDTPSEHHDRDTDKSQGEVGDKDLKACIHPFLGLPVPSYGCSVRGALINIISEERHVSEKSFSALDAIINEAEEVIGQCAGLVEEFEKSDARPKLCAEVLYGIIMANSTPSQFFYIRASFRDTMMLAKRELAMFPTTFTRLMGKLR